MVENNTPFKVTKNMLLVKRHETCLREFVVRRHKKFQLERIIEKAVKEPYEGKGLSADEFY